jgi:hypothetical protein
VIPHYVSYTKYLGLCISGIPRDVSFNVVQDTFASVEGIVAVHNLRIWGLTTDKTALAAHLVIGKALSIVYLYNPTDWVVQQKIGLILPVKIVSYDTFRRRATQFSLISVDSVNTPLNSPTPSLSLCLSCVFIVCCSHMQQSSTELSQP